MKKWLQSMAYGAMLMVGGAIPLYAQSHTFSVVAALDMRGWVGPRVTGPETLWGRVGEAGDLVAGARLTSTYLGFNYAYGAFAGATIQLNLEGVATNFYMNNPQSIGVGVRRAHGWVDPLGLLDANKYVGLKITAGYLHYQPAAGLNAPAWEGGPATAFEMGTSATMTRAFQLDQLAWRVDMPINAIEAFKLNFAAVSDLDFSRNGYGWSILGEVTASDVRFGEWGQMGINAHYHHWQGGDPRLGEGEEWYPMTPDQIIDSENVTVGAVGNGSHFRGGEGVYGSHLVGGSINFKFFLPNDATITAGMIMDYQWYFGHYRIQKYLEEFDRNLVSGTNGTYFGERKASLSYEAGVNFHYPKWVTLNAAYVARVLGSNGFSIDEGLYGRKPNSFVSVRTDWHFMESFSKISPFVGVSVGINEAQKGFWEQVGRIGYEVGLQYKPTGKMTIRTGWHAGSQFLGAIYDPGLVKSRNGHFYLRFYWGMSN